jgi:hypothetical protein
MELSAAKEALLSLVGLVILVGGIAGARWTEYQVLVFLFSFIAALGAFGFVALAVAALVHRTTGTSPIVQYVDRLVYPGARDIGTRFHLAQVGTRGTHPWLMGPTAKSRLPIGGASGPLQPGLTRYGGKVTEQLGGEPIAGVMVWPAEQLDRAVRTDGEGEWNIDLTSGRAWTFHFEREGYERPVPREATPTISRIDLTLRRTQGQSS